MNRLPTLRLYRRSPDAYLIACRLPQDVGRDHLLLLERHACLRTPLRRTRRLGVVTGESLSCWWRRVGVLLDAVRRH